jgi:8-oxo-dGTP diphosphatase
MSGPQRFRPSAKAVVVRDGRLLVTRNRTPDDPRPDWHIFPGGGQEPGESLVAALVREVREETGVEIVPGPLLWVRELTSAMAGAGYPGDPAEHVLEFMFAAEFGVDHGDAHAADLFQVAVVWITPEELPQLRFYPEEVVPQLLRYLGGGESGPTYLGMVN